MSRAPRSLTLLLLALLALVFDGCARELPASPQDISALWELHATPLSRSTCPGCPANWNLRPCTFLEELLKAGTGAEAAMCQSLTARGDSRGLPEHVRSVAQQRLGEALERVDAQSRAVDALAAQAPSTGWPNRLLRLAQNAPPSVRVTDMLILDALATELTIDGGDMASLKRASIFANNAVQTSGDRRAEQLVGFAEARAWPVDATALWRGTEAQRDRAISAAINAVLREVTSDGRRCPSLRALVPALLWDEPVGWTVDRERCEAKKTTPPRG